MKSLFDFIVEPVGERYDNKVKVGDKSLIINTQVETFKSVNNIAKVIEVPLSDFLNDNYEVTSKILDANGTTHSVPAFKLKGQIVWGATAMVLVEIKTMLNLVLKK